MNFLERNPLWSRTPPSWVRAPSGAANNVIMATASIVSSYQGLFSTFPEITEAMRVRTSRGICAWLVWTSNSKEASPAMRAAKFASTTPTADDESMLNASCCCLALTKTANSSGLSEKERTPTIFQREPAMQPHWYAAPERYTLRAPKMPALSVVYVRSDVE